jgi:hypothetical protein
VSETEVPPRRLGEHRRLLLSDAEPVAPLGGAGGNERDERQRAHHERPEVQRMRQRANLISAGYLSALTV